MAVLSLSQLPAARSARPPLMRVAIWLVMAVALAGLLAIARSTDWADVTTALIQLGPAEITLLLTLSLVNYVARALRWHVFTRRLGLGTDLATDLRHYIGGFAMTVTPGRLGELVRMRWLARETGTPVEVTAPLALLDRAADLAATGLLLGLGMLIAFGTRSDGSLAAALPVAAFAIFAAVLVTRPSLLERLAIAGHRLSGRVPRLWVKLRRSAVSLRLVGSGRVWLLALALGAAGWMAEVLAFDLLLSWMGADIGLATVTVIFVFSMIAGGLTGAPGGLGGAELAMIALLQTQSVPPEVSVPATAVIRLTTLWFAIGLGWLVFPLAERHAARAR